MDEQLQALLEKIHDLLHLLANKTVDCRKCFDEREMIITDLYVTVDEYFKQKHKYKEAKDGKVD